jgi:hypothetical protein
VSATKRLPRGSRAALTGLVAAGGSHPHIDSTVVWNLVGFGQAVVSKDVIAITAKGRADIGAPPPAEAPSRFTAAERTTLEPLIARAAVAAVRQAKTKAGSYAADEAQRETCAAGKALAAALKKLRGGK